MLYVVLLEFIIWFVDKMLLFLNLPSKCICIHERPEISTLDDFCRFLSDLDISKLRCIVHFTKRHRFFQVEFEIKCKIWIDFTHAKKNWSLFYDFRAEKIDEQIIEDKSSLCQSKSNNEKTSSFSLQRSVRSILYFCRVLEKPSSH